MEDNFLCPVCNIPAEQLGIGNLIEPFWQRLAKFFCYPLQLHPLILMTVITLFAVFFPSFIVRFLCFMVSLKYGYSILTATARGNLKAPGAIAALFTSDVSQVFKLYLLCIVLATLQEIVLRYTGVLGGNICSLAIFLLLPAMVMILVAANSVIAALNPMIVLPITVRIGWHYLLMLLFLILLPMAPASLLPFFSGIFPWAVLQFITIFFLQYYVFIMFNLMGYVLLQYHEEIGYDVDYDHFISSSLSGQEKPRSQSLEEGLNHQITMLVKKGLHQEALQVMREEMVIIENNVELSAKYYSLLKMCQQREWFCQHAPGHLRLLIDRNKRVRAIEVYQELAEDEEITLATDLVLTIGNWLMERDAYQQAAQCYSRFIKDNPRDSRLPEAWLQMIKLYHEHFNSTEQAIKLAEAVLAKYPDHSLVAELKAYLQIMR
jgi:tetratricopeptide (TPR) repeat protein